MDLYKHLLEIDNASDYVRNLIDQDRLAKADPEYIKLKKKELQDQIKALDELKKVSQEDPEKVREILEMAQNQYDIRMNSPSPDLEGFKFWCRSSILPKLKKARCNRFEVNDIVEMCSKGVIEV